MQSWSPYKRKDINKDPKGYAIESLQIVMSRADLFTLPYVLKTTNFLCDIIECETHLADGWDWRVASFMYFGYDQSRFSRAILFEMAAHLGMLIADPSWSWNF